MTRQPRQRRIQLSARGEPLIWLSGGALVLCVTMIAGLLLLIISLGMSTFWPDEVVRLTTRDGRVYMGEVTREQDAGENGESAQQLVRTGNFKLTQNHFQWVKDAEVQQRENPDWALVVERLEWGRFYGFPTAFARVIRYLEPGDGPEEIQRLVAAYQPRINGACQILVEFFEDGESRRTLRPLEDLDADQTLIGLVERVTEPAAIWKNFQRFHGPVRERWQQRRSLEKDDTGEINADLEAVRLALKEAQLENNPAAVTAAEEAYEIAREEAETAFRRVRGQIDEIDQQNARTFLMLTTAGEGALPARETLLQLDEVVRAYPANRLDFWDKLGIYASRWVEYLTDEPREANSEGGVFPAIFGTVLMTLLMALAVVPFGVLAALYLREYAKAGMVVSAVRIAVNNLAGVPSIVFGVFGLGFFCYGVGGFIDGGPEWAMPKTSWFVLLGTAVGIGALAFLFLMAGMVRPGRELTPGRRMMRGLSLILWVASGVAVLVLVATTPFFEGFYRANLPNPTFGKGALVWASFTLALMTLPVVIVATEEALSAVPNSMREGSYACGASKWQTLRRIVLPRALPGIMTGMILAMARGAGEVAPLMLVGAVKMAPELPFDLGPPFGINRSFMHLGFHIYDVGFQSQNSEAAKPMVFTTTLLLIAIVALMNLFAIWLRSRLKRRFKESQF